MSEGFFSRGFRGRRRQPEGDTQLPPGQYLEGVDYPASKEEVVNAAEQNGAPDTMIRMLEGLSRPEFSGQEEVMDDLRAFPQSN